MGIVTQEYDWNVTYSCLLSYGYQAIYTHPVLPWCVGCVKLETRDFNRSIWALFQYPIRHLTDLEKSRSRYMRDWKFELSYCFDIWQGPRQQCCRGACQMSERSDNFKHKSRCFKSSQDLTIWYLIRYWNGALDCPRHLCSTLLIAMLYARSHCIRHIILNSKLMHHIWCLYNSDHLTFIKAIPFAGKTASLYWHYPSVAPGHPCCTFGQLLQHANSHDSQIPIGIAVSGSRDW